MQSSQRMSSSIIAASILAFSASLASGHITLLTPNGGESFTAGSTVSIEWQIDIRHNQQNWDLWFSTESSSGEWVEIVLDLDPGATNAGSIHSFEWVVPDIFAEDVWVRARMDNTGIDYFDVSNGSFSIVPAPGSVSFLAVASIAATRRRR